MTDDQRHEAAKAVAQWLTEECGEEVAGFWVWERTPMPCGLPSDAQLEEGLRWAAEGVKFKQPQSP